MALSEDYGIVGSDIGAFVGDVAGDAGGLTRQFSGLQVNEVAISADDPDRSLVALFNGEVHQSDNKGQSYALHSVLPGSFEALSLLEVNGTVYAGTNGAGVLRWNPGLLLWEECGVMPFTEVGDYVLHIPVLQPGVDASDASVIVATNGHEGVFLTSDRCDTWELSQTNEFPEYGGIGNAQSAEEGFTTAGISGRYAWLVGFNGITTVSYTHLTLPTNREV